MKVWNEIEAVMVEANKSQTRSLSYYWPADAGSNNDLAENNLALHVAQAFLKKNYAVFAEVNHPVPNAKGNKQNIDLLAIAEDRSFYIAMEFKRHVATGMDDSLDDIERLVSFGLNKNLEESQCGIDPVKILIECKKGFALIAGLKWYPGKSVPDLESYQSSDRIKELQGTINCLGTYTYPGGSYWLQYGCFSKESF